MLKNFSLKDVKYLKEEIIKKLENFQINSDVEEFLYYLSKILIETEFKKNYKKIIKITKKLNKNIDEIYLIYFKKYDSIKFFENKENKFLIEGFYDLIEILNLNGKIKDSDEINRNLSKLELGYKRYFNLRNNVEIDFFIPNLKKYQIKGKENIYFYEYVDNILEGKNEKIREKEFQKISKIINYFPERIYIVKNKKYLEYEKSLFLNENFYFKKIDKYYIINQNSIYSIYKIIKLINFIENKY
jgi:hypothetical protein